MPIHSPNRQIKQCGAPHSRGRYPGRAALVVVAMASTTSAHAYIDPGTGSILLQSLLAGVAVAIGVLRAYWHRIRSFFSSAQSGTASKAHTDTVDEEAKARSES